MTTNCSEFSIAPVLPSSQSLQCALQTDNTIQMKPCCKSEVKQFDSCILYCEPNNDLQEFISCVSASRNPAELRTDAFCQRNVKSEIKESTAKTHSGGNGTSFAVHSARAPSIPALLTILLVVTLLLVTPVSASANSNTLTARADPHCRIDVDSHYTQPRSNTIQVSSNFDCNGVGKFCSFGQRVETSLMSNNRTLNGTDAADAKYDAFFQILGNSTTPKRLFPAMSGLSVWYDWAALQGSTTYLGFTPIQYCVKGTVSDCSGVLGQSDDTVAFEACGPEFRDETGLNGDNVIQGDFGVVTTS